MILIFIIILCHGFIHYALPDSCDESRKTIAYVSYCPRNSTEWFHASLRKKCSSIQHSCETFLYHCLINPFVNATLEVCAPKTNILGNRCAEYNMEGGLVQDNRLASCENHTSPCKFIYSSDEAYKYQECYKLVYSNKESSYTTPSRKKIENSSIEGIDTENYSNASEPSFSTRCKEDHRNTAVLSVCLGIAIAFAITETVVLMFCWRKAKTSDHTTLKESADHRYKRMDVSGYQDEIPGPNDRDSNDEVREAVQYNCEPVELTATDKPKTLFVAAIDIGATYSGYAYSIRSEKEWKTIYTSSRWDKRLITTKTLSAILFDEKCQFLNFGYEAEEEYYKPENNEKSYTYCCKLHELSYNAKQQSLIEITSENGHSLKAKEVLGKFIECLLELLITEEKRSNKIDGVQHVSFVLTIPNDWNSIFRRTFTNAAILAGIPEDNLLVINEAEAVPNYLSDYLNDKRCKSYNWNFKEPLLKPGDSYMVLDLGGSRVDLIFLNIKNVDEHEITKVLTKRWGEMSPEKRFHKFISILFGDDVVRKKQNHCDYIQLLQAFQKKIGDMDKSKSTESFISVPQSLLDMVKCDRFSDSEENVNSRAQEEFKGSVTFKNCQLKVKRDQFHSYFLKPSANMLETFLNEKCNDRKEIMFILMIGGNSNKNFMQKAVKKTFPSDRIIIPNEAELTVLRGAVLKGHTFFGLPQKCDKK